MDGKYVLFHHICRVLETTLLNLLFRKDVEATLFCMKAAHDALTSSSLTPLEFLFDQTTIETLPSSGAHRVRWTMLTLIGNNVREPCNYIAKQRDRRICKLFYIIKCCLLTPSSRHVYCERFDRTNSLLTSIHDLKGAMRCQSLSFGPSYQFVCRTAPQRGGFRSRREKQGLGKHLERYFRITSQRCHHSYTSCSATLVGIPSQVTQLSDGWYIYSLSFFFRELALITSEFYFLLHI